MKIGLLALLVLIGLVKTAWGQNSNIDYKSAFKIYNLTSVEEQTKTISITDSTYSVEESTSVQLFSPSIAFQLQTKKYNSHEIELSRFTVGKEITSNEIVNDSTNTSQFTAGSEVTTTRLAVRYEYVIHFNRSKNSKFVPSIGFGVSPYYHRNNYLPKTSNFFPTSDTQVGMRTFITPRLNYFLNSKLFLDLNFPLCFFDAHVLSDQQNDPTVPANQGNISVFNFTQFPSFFSGRIGVGIKLWW